MQVLDSQENDPESSKNPENSEALSGVSMEDNTDKNKNKHESSDDEVVLDVSGNNLELSLLENSENSVEGLYLYKNVFDLIPKSVGGLGRLKTLKFFGNEINLLPPEFSNLVGLECLQVKIPTPGLKGLSTHKLKGLKELELSKVPPRPSVLTILSEIAGLKCLTKLSVCHFSIRYLPPEIGCLNKLEHLDLSFNKIKSLPTEIRFLNALILLKVANNKLVEVPVCLSSLKRLENLDLSSNRLTSLGSLDLGLMPNLKNLDLQYNKLQSCCQIPSWIRCNLEGNGKDLSNDDFISSSVEMDVYESTYQEHGSLDYNGSRNTSSNLLAGSPSNNRCCPSKKSFKRRLRAGQERLNNNRKWKGEGHGEVLSVKADKNFNSLNLDILCSETCSEGALDVIGLDVGEKQLASTEARGENLVISIDNDETGDKKEVSSQNCSGVDLQSIGEGGENDCCELDVASDSKAKVGSNNEECSSSESEACKTTILPKRHCDGDLDNPKPCKFRKPIDSSCSLSCKYSDISLCSTEDCLPDGFYDAGRDRPFMPLTSYEQILPLHSREVILVDRQRDEELDAIVHSARALVFHLKQLNDFTKDGVQVSVDNMQIASLLALFVSDHFGGSDRSGTVDRTRKAISGSNYQKPFVCTCSTGTSESVRNTSTKQVVDDVEDLVFTDICERSLQSIKLRRNSIIVPLGSLMFGVCRHRALLMKYLCDHMEPPIPCELVRGYLDFLPHAWNTVLVKKGDLWIRMIVDACHPHDIREESDPEYFCRYIPLCRTIPFQPGSCATPSCSFPSFSECDEIEKANNSSLIRCKFGQIGVAAKVRTLECETSADEMKKFEYNCIGEVRILGALKHPCIVQMYGHQISSKWLPLEDGNPVRRTLQSAILMEYVKGGSLKSYLEKLSEAGKKHAPPGLALRIAQDVASALVELHSKHIIHRDLKSENILIDLEREEDGEPVAKLCDFDRAVPLRSFLHTCCIAHLGIPPPDVCVGTPRWMAPEVLKAIDKPNKYGLEVDIWSYGCLLFEILTLQVPYLGLADSYISELLQNGKRPPLTNELEALLSSNESEMAQSGTELNRPPESELETLRFLVDVFHHCTEENPNDRPAAGELYKMLVSHTTNFPRPTS